MNRLNPYQATERSRRFFEAVPRTVGLTLRENGYGVAALLRASDEELDELPYIGERVIALIDRELAGMGLVRGSK